MNKSKKPPVKKYIVAVLLFAAILAASLMNYQQGTRAIINFRTFLYEMVFFLPLMFILIGLLDVWLPKKLVEKHIGQSSGFMGAVWVILLAMFQAGPLYGAFPVAKLLWGKGCRIRNVFIYIGAFATLKIPMLTFETAFLGFKFTLIRTLLTLPIFILIAIFMDKSLQKSKYTLPE